jgi:hypothetical protein
LEKNPNDYYKLDDFMGNDNDKNQRGGGKKFQKRKQLKDMKGFSVKYKTKEKRMNDFKHFQKKSNKRPGKVKRMMNRNKKNSMKHK